jgi:F-type H+-transporting ATPase subunit b
MLSFNLTSIVNLVGFFLFIVFLYKLMYKPFFEITDKRKQEIEKNLNEAERLRISAQEDKSELEKKLKEIKLEREEIILKANEQAKSILNKAKENAEKEKERLILKAESDAQDIKNKAVQDIQQKVVGISVAIASMILKEKIDTTVNEEIVKRAIRQFDSKGDSL